MLDTTQATTSYRITLSTAISTFCDDRKAAQCSPATLIWYRKYLAALADWMAEQSVSTITDVHPTHLRAWLCYLAEERELGKRSIHHHASAARSLFNWLSEQELLLCNPMGKVKMPPLPNDVLSALEREEVDAIVSACRAPRDTAIVLFLVDTGVRAGELLALNVGDVNTTRGTVVIRHGKGDKARTVCFGTKTRKALLKYLMTRQHTEADAPLWVIEDGSRLTYWALRDMLERLKGRCKVENCHPHAFRRTFALWSLRAGMDIYSLQMLMGHSSLRMLRQYLALVTADIEHAHQQHGPVDHTLGKR